MYENDYSYWPQALVVVATLSAFGSLLISLIRTGRARRRIMGWWYSVPLLFSASFGICVALYAENIEPITPVLAVPFMTLLLLPPWAVASAVVFAVSRRVQRMLNRES